MKIGILTYHRSNNYGALLQAIALREVLSDMGHEVSFIDYWPAYHKHMYAIFSFSLMLSLKGFQKKVSYLASCIYRYPYRKKRKDNFERFIQTYIEPYLSSVEETYDIIVHGSDQIWRKQPEIKTYNPIYFGKHSICTSKKISYAASMGIISNDKNDKHIIKEYLSNLDTISVREKELRELVTGLGYDCKICLDPTLLLNNEQWHSLINFEPTIPGIISGKYVLHYKLLNNSFDEQAIKEFAKRRDIELITLYGDPTKETENKITTASPEQMLSLINGAEYVFTSSYHGMVFSILFHKPFYASFSRNVGRAKSLLSDLHLSERLLEPKAPIPQSECLIDFSKVDDILKSKRKPSLDYLEKIVK